MDCTNVIIWTVFSCHILVNSSCISIHEERWCSCNFLDLHRKRGLFESGLDRLLLRLKILRVFNQTDAGSSLDGTKRDLLTVS